MTRGGGWFFWPKALALEALCSRPRLVWLKRRKSSVAPAESTPPVKVTPLAFDPDVGLIYPPTVVGRFEFRAQTSFHFRGVTLHPPPDGNVVDESSWARKRDSAAAERRLILRHRV